MGQSPPRGAPEPAAAVDRTEHPVGLVSVGFLYGDTRACHVTRPNWTRLVSELCRPHTEEGVVYRRGLTKQSRKQEAKSRVPLTRPHPAPRDFGLRGGGAWTAPPRAARSAQPAVTSAALLLQASRGSRATSSWSSGALPPRPLRPRSSAAVTPCPRPVPYRSLSPDRRLTSKDSSRCSPESGPGGPRSSRRVQWAFFTSASRAQRPRGLSSLLASHSCPARASRSCPRTRSPTCRYAWRGRGRARRLGPAVRRATCPARAGRRRRGVCVEDAGAKRVVCYRKLF